MKKHQLKIESQTDNLEEMRSFVSGIAEKMGFGPDERDQIELAVDEACTNVIKHAYNYETDKVINLIVKVENEKLTIIIEDTGLGFDPGEVELPDMDQYIKEMRVGGLGIYLMKTLMDEIDYEIEPGAKNKVTLIKHLQKKPKEAYYLYGP